MSDINLDLVWADPPAGWRYGFPKVYEGNKYPDLNKWLVDNGYPQDIIDRYRDGGMPFRFFQLTPEEKIEYAKTSTN